VLLLATNGFFVAAEFAIVAVRRGRVEQLAAQGRGDARAATKVVAHLDTYIAACQVGITLASLILGWIGEPALAHLIEPPVAALVGAFAPAIAHGVSIVISLALITALHIIVGEQAPKGLALQRAEAVVLWTARPLQLFELVFRWPTFLLQRLTGLLLRLIGLDAVTGHGSVHSVEELNMLVSGSRAAGVVEDSEARIAMRAFNFADLTAGALMTPRTEVEAISLDAPRGAVAALAGRARHVLLPVYQGTLDTIVGVLSVVDFYRASAARPAVEAESLAQSGFELRSLLRPTMVVPESKPADDILEEMRTAGTHFAVVIDEYGGTAGILTLDDLLEAIVGPIREMPTLGEAPHTGSEAPAASDGSLVFEGLMRLEEWEENTGLRASEEDHAQAETLGGVIMWRLGRIPEVGDEVMLGGRALRVEALDGLRVSLVRMLPETGRQTKAPGFAILAVQLLETAPELVAGAV
jgi:putative hemolysin